MDPLHITEFASNRYFEKLNQLRENDSNNNINTSNNNANVEEGHPVDGLSARPLLHQESTFILPLRAAPASDGDIDACVGPDAKRQKRSLFSKFLHTKSSSTGVQDQEQRQTSLAGSTKRPSSTFDQLFLSLPNELQIQVIASLPLTDILTLRQASRSWHVLISLNEAPLVRYHLEHHVPAYATRLYPPPEPAALNFHYLCGIWHRLHVAAKLAALMCEQITKEIFLRTTEEQRQEFAPQRERMRRRLIPLLFTIFHFFETYRALHLQYMQDHDGHGLLEEPYTWNPVEAKVMNMYDDRTLLRVHQVFPLVISTFCRRLRPPSYAGRVERSLRGYLKEKPPDEVHVAALLIGGLREVERFWEIKGYMARRNAIDSWYGSITREPKEMKEKEREKEKDKEVVAEPAFKARRFGLGLRKKPSLAIREKAVPQILPSGSSVHATAEGSNSGGRAGSTFEPVLENTAAPTAFVFNTSMATGMPMMGLSREQLRLLLPDLPVLQKIWLTTAEAMILDRKVVERPADIKRNAQVLIELIREDGMAEEDEWLYGRPIDDMEGRLAE